MLQANPKAADLIITDHLMPGQTGTDLARLLEKLCPGLPIVLCSGHLASLDEAELASAGIVATLEKPVVARKLARIVRQALDQR